ncbi:(2Fe-2S)-binding protein [Roseovarius aestuarii]|nr:(2Fe-2S)-binding protein [Roseovarius aestuarii]
MTHGLFAQIEPDTRASVQFTFDGTPVNGFVGDTVLAALLRSGTYIGQSEFDGTPRAGFCLMGSCQDCTLWDSDGRRLRACMVDIQSDMDLRSTPYRDTSDHG